MPKTIEIKAELLKWCPYGFEFKLNRENVKLTCTAEYGFICTNPFFSNYNCKFSTPSTITVNAKEYEKAVIERIKEMMPTAEFLVKIRNHEHKMCFAQVRTTGIPSRNIDLKLLKLNIDPRPNESEYTIEVNDGNSKK